MNVSLRWYGTMAAVLLSLLPACRPELTGRKLYLYVTQQDRATFNDVVAEADKETRKEGTELLFYPLDDFFSGSANDVRKSLDTGDSLAVVIYEEDWGPKLENRIKKLLTLLSKGQDSQDSPNAQSPQNPKKTIGLWIMGKGRTPVLPKSVRGLMGQGFDAVSSPSAERPAKRAAKEFFLPLIKQPAERGKARKP
ncbi:hypothetical protein P0082_09515 [Candidatus Haliotispira prima]|uniref:DUF4174 domain-containing protein n=1 Tax=Candidatus Haliotispira prima TaxID=3034016 RepID=A0ABY8MHN9_9SPIO|nr:hypothetical protein P0082_09515 [Candidatus Haliotispira prima]